MPSETWIKGVEIGRRDLIAIQSKILILKQTVKSRRSNDMVGLGNPLRRERFDWAHPKPQAKAMKSRVFRIDRSLFKGPIENEEVLVTLCNQTD
jgi:hypothetical protein